MGVGMGMAMSVDVAVGVVVSGSTQPGSNLPIKINLHSVQFKISKPAWLSGCFHRLGFELGLH
jgi:hypothetical protein